MNRSFNQFETPTNLALAETTFLRLSNWIHRLKRFDRENITVPPLPRNRRLPTMPTSFGLGRSLQSVTLFFGAGSLVTARLLDETLDERAVVNYTQKASSNASPFKILYFQ